MKISKKREHWKEMVREAVDIKRKILRKQKYGANGTYASYRRHAGSKKHATSNNFHPYIRTQL